MTSLGARPVRLFIFGGALVFPALVVPACSGNPLAGLCRDVCDCAGCSDSEEERCVEAADESQADAEKEGCTEELDAYATCLKDAFKCDDRDAVFTESCETESEDLVDCGVSPPGTSGANVCDQAAEACGVAEGEGEPVDCTGTVECQAQCIVDFNCDLTGEALGNCINGC